MFRPDRIEHEIHEIARLGTVRHHAKKCRALRGMSAYRRVDG
jgi:hypothetical protein